MTYQYKYIFIMKSYTKYLQIVHKKCKNFRVHKLNQRTNITDRKVRKVTQLICPRQFQQRPRPINVFTANHTPILQ